MRRKQRPSIVAGLTLAIVAAACGGDGGNGGGDGGVTGSLNVSGSSTVEPITSLVAEKFRSEHPDVEIAVDGPGTSDGFELFCNGETDISDASRAIDEEELAACQENGIEPVELEVGLDALTVIGNPANPIECLSFGDLYALFGPEAEGFGSWSDANGLAAEVGGVGGFPDMPLTIVAPGAESGTFGSFIEIALKDIAGEREQPDDVLRTDYQSSADDNVIIDNAAGNESGLGFVGFSYAQAAGATVKEFEVDGGSGCVAPSPETVIDGTYPIARSLFLYVNPIRIQDNPALEPFVDFYLSDAGIASVEEVGYVALPSDRLDATRSAWEDANA
ncbi:MAG TPA: substrate-binding domain-containing protein [Actinomycetota bacterium]|nr:substrate-binding domain-containing protein [Actinomycetota bacterium]